MHGPATGMPVESGRNRPNSNLSPIHEAEYYEKPVTRIPEAPAKSTLITGFILDQREFREPIGGIQLMMAYPRTAAASCGVRRPTQERAISFWAQIPRHR